MSLTLTEETEYKSLALKANNNEYLSDSDLRRLDTLDEKKRRYSSSSLTSTGRAKVSRVKTPSSTVYPGYSSSSRSSSSDDSSSSSSRSSSSDDSGSSSSWSSSSDSGSSFDGGGSSSDW